MYRVGTKHYIQTQKHQFITPYYILDVLRLAGGGLTLLKLKTPCREGLGSFTKPIASLWTEVLSSF
jgi:hypothetical protein